eukprot:CAMPEP_0117072512 /NCGR_PEP_ID=MMETSP0472-20121206/51052_1 /TAXON_ID=693140 ORGANISM="Tiarina fusus, Strain LIS" /NCGR_SAMPLE_ID=MMETSP0472 /ASSEMBLY_ACC=CAM_ASM_000603 /LENGTH=147 /DNA_ID=CAMNT_0004796675 /DNA_START=324 /DNA_END=764 /DNA_ORIENTATION=+
MAMTSSRRSLHLSLGWQRPLFLLLLLCFLLSSHSTTNAQQAPNPLYQIPAFTTPTIATTTITNSNRTTFRNDVCHLAANRDNLQILPEILQGVALHPLLMLGEFANVDYEYDDNDDETVITNITLNKEYPGLIPLLLDELCLRAGCT